MYFILLSCNKLFSLKTNRTDVGKTQYLPNNGHSSKEIDGNREESTVKSNENFTLIIENMIKHNQYLNFLFYMTNMSYRVI